MGTFLLAYILNLAWTGLEVANNLVRTRHWDLPVAVIGLAALLVVTIQPEPPHLAVQTIMVGWFGAFLAFVGANLRRRQQPMN